MRYLLSFLLLFGIAFGQKIVTMSEADHDGQKLEVKKEYTDEQVTVTITKDGKTETFTADVNDKEAVEKLNEKLAEYDPECKVVANKHNCKNVNCDKHKVVWNMKNGDNDEEVRKIVKIHEPTMINETAGYLGVHIQNITEQLAKYFKIKDEKGVLVTEVEDDSPAEKAGLLAGDIITKVNDEEVATTSELSKTVRSYEPNTEVTVSVVRNGKNKQLKATLAESKMDLFAMHHDFEMPDMPEIEKLQFHNFNIDTDKLRAEVDALKKELDDLKLQFDKFQENR